MAIASFANKTFQVSSQRIYTFDDFTSGAALQTEKQDVAGKKPSTYIKGSDLETLSFSIPMHTIFGVNIIAEYNIWKTIMNAGKPYSFILGNKPFGPNKWLLTNVSLKDTLTDKKGTILKASLDLQFDEYVRAGSVAASKSKSKKTAKKKTAKKSTAKGVSQGDKNILNSLVSGADKSSQKRSNSNASAALSKGSKK